MPPSQPEPLRRRPRCGAAPPGRWLRGSTVLLLLTLGAVLAGSAACRSVRNPPPQAPLAALSRGEHLLATGDEVGAAAAYQQHLAAGDGVAGGDLALLRLALLRLEAGGPLHDPAAAVRLLRRLLAVHPQSPYAAAAALILDLRHDNRRLDAEVARLREQLEELRRIDLDGP